MKPDRKCYALWNKAARCALASFALAGSAMLAVAALMVATQAVAEPRTRAKSFFLVASADMPDPVFQQSVILMLPEDEPPLVAGVIINKPTDVTLGSLFKPPLAPQNRSQKVYFGGPVDLDAPLLVIRSVRQPKVAIKLWTDVYEVEDASSIGDILKDPRSGGEARLYMGRAQWAQEQLRGELLEGAWSVVPVNTNLIFEHDSAKVWRMLSQHQHVREIMAHCGGVDGVLTLTMCNESFTH